MKVLHIACYSTKDPIPILEKNISKLNKKICLVTIAQHLDQLPKVKKFLEKNDKEVFVGGQILGCDQSKTTEFRDKAGCFLYIGSGKFHPLAISLRTEQPVFVLNPISQDFYKISDEEKVKWEKKNRGRISRAIGAEIFGILISTKSGQFNLRGGLSIKKNIEKIGKKAFLFAGEQINPENVLPFKVDAWINTACPRIVDDFFDRPILNPDELKFVMEN